MPATNKILVKTATKASVAAVLRWSEQKVVGKNSKTGFVVSPELAITYVGPKPNALRALARAATILAARGLTVFANDGQLHVTGLAPVAVTE